MILIALNSTELDINTLGGRDSEECRDTLIAAVAVDSDTETQVDNNEKRNGKKKRPFWVVWN